LFEINQPTQFETFARSEFGGLLLNPSAGKLSKLQIEVDSLRRKERQKKGVIEQQKPMKTIQQNQDTFNEKLMSHVT
jgi:hypothetical protein